MRNTLAIAVLLLVAGCAQEYRDRPGVRKAPGRVEAGTSVCAFMGADTAQRSVRLVAEELTSGDERVSFYSVESGQLLTRLTIAKDATLQAEIIESGEFLGTWSCTVKKPAPAPSPSASPSAQPA